MSVTRRRFITITAAAAGFALLPRVPGSAAQAGQANLRSWRGVALGADATLRINHPDPAVADRLIERSIGEVRRLERIFSLYAPDTAISLLNRQGRMEEPPADFLRLLSESENYARMTGGAFDITVQPLWRLYADHFSTPGADLNGPSAQERVRAIASVGHDAIAFDASRVEFMRPGMGLTFNGIAQGYITDRVTELLLASGIERALVDMGEIRALGESPSGEPWRVGIEDPRKPEHIAETVELASLAIATSGGYGTAFDPAGRSNHIFDPRTGLTARRYLGVSVLAPSATTADALSTAFSLMPLDDTQAIVRRLGIEARFVLPDGKRVVQTA